jgi:hypothetical protein
MDEFSELRDVVPALGTRRRVRLEIMEFLVAEVSTGCQGS